MTSSLVTAFGRILGVSALLGSLMVCPAETPPAIEWQQVLGGTGSDTVRAITPASDGSLFVYGESASDVSGNKTSPQHGGGDFWLARLDARGNVLWDRSFGGTERESVAAPGVITRDGGFVLGGMSRSGVSGNKTSPGYGLDDAWLVKVNTEGNKVWEKSHGGSDSEWLWVALPLSDGGFLAGGYSRSGVSGTKESLNYGGLDFWLLKLDSQGNELWDRSFGGTGDESLTSILPTTGGGFLLCGDSSSPASGNKTSPRHGQADIWLVKIDADGNKLWDKSYGGTDYDIPAGMVRTADGGFLLGGQANTAGQPNTRQPNVPWQRNLARLLDCQGRCQRHLCFGIKFLEGAALMFSRIWRWRPTEDLFVAVHRIPALAATGQWRATADMITGFSNSPGRYASPSNRPGAARASPGRSRPQATCWSKRAS